MMIPTACLCTKGRMVDLFDHRAKRLHFWSRPRLRYGKSCVRLARKNYRTTVASLREEPSRQGRFAMARVSCRDSVTLPAQQINVHSCRRLFRHS